MKKILFVTALFLLMILCGIAVAENSLKVSFLNADETNRTTEMYIDEPYTDSLWTKGAEKVEVINTFNGKETSHTTVDHDVGYGSGGSGGYQVGEYTRKVMVWFLDGEYCEVELKITVKSKGKLQSPVVEAPSYIEAGEIANLTIHAVENANWYWIYVTRNGFEVIGCRIYADYFGANGTYDYVIDTTNSQYRSGDSFDPADIEEISLGDYVISITAGSSGYEESDPTNVSISIGKEKRETVRLSTDLSEDYTEMDFTLYAPYAQEWKFYRVDSDGESLMGSGSGPLHTNRYYWFFKSNYSDSEAKDQFPVTFRLDVKIDGKWLHDSKTILGKLATPTFSKLPATMQIGVRSTFTVVPVANAEYYEYSTGTSETAKYTGRLEGKDLSFTGVFNDEDDLSNTVWVSVTAFAEGYIPCCTDVDDIDLINPNATDNIEKNNDDNWVFENNQWKYRNGDGYVSGWYEINGSVYYFDPKTNEMVTGPEVIDGDEYYFTEDGKRYTGFVDNGFYGGKYFAEDGKSPNGWHEVNGEMAYFEYGYMIRDQLYYIEGDGTYYFDSEGHATKVQGWFDYKVYDDTIQTVYILENGSHYVGWQKIDGKTHFFNGQGWVKKGFQNINNDTYFFDPDDHGKMLTGLQRIDGEIYYFNSNGVRLSGWQEINGDTYYFHPQAYRNVTVKLERNGQKESCSFDANGKLILPENPDTPEEPHQENEVKINGLTYLLEGKIAVFKSASSSAKSIVIPATIKVGKKTYKVTAIADNSCKGMKKLTSLTIGKNVKSIGKKAFYNCKKLGNVIINTSSLDKNTIGKEAFNGTPKTIKIKVPRKKVELYKTILVKAGVNKKATITK